MAPTISYIELEAAYHFGSSDGGFGENWAVLDVETGKFLYAADDEDLDQIPEDVDVHPERYLAVPTQHDLMLGRPLVFDFVRQVIPDHADTVHQFFSRRGAYGRFKSFLDREGLLDRWHAFENAAVTRGLCEWADANGIKVAGLPEEFEQEAQAQSD